MGWLGPALQGLFGLGGAIFGSRSNNKATQAQERANAEALAFERQKFEEEMAFSRAQWEARERMLAPRRSLYDAFVQSRARAHGLNMPSTGMNLAGPGSLAGIGGRVSGALGNGTSGNRAMARQESVDARRNSLRAIAGG